MSSNLSLFREYEQSKSGKMSKRKPVGNGRIFLWKGKKKMERITAMEAVNLGLLEAVESGETKIECKVKLEKGKLKIEHRKFCFKDKTGKMREGKFKDETELIAFAMIFYPDDEEEEEKYPVLEDKSLAKVVENILRKKK